jgi:tRNA A22 N-methylase
MKINDRLKTIGDLADANSFCLDVGCDHALLDIHLSQNKIITLKSIFIS